MQESSSTTRRNSLETPLLSEEEKQADQSPHHPPNFGALTTTTTTMSRSEMLPLSPSMSADNDIDIAHSGSNDDGSDVPVDAWRQRLIQYQQYASIASHLSALASILVVIIWITHLGGLSWKYGESKQVFNWHPLLMITAFAFMTVASLSFRNFNRPKSKTLHGLSWSVAILCMIVGLVAVFRSHNDGISGYVANLYSLHSWIGLLVLISYSFQFLSGMMAFGFPKIWTWNGVALASESFKSRLLLVHHFAGRMIYLSMCITILMGIQEKEGFIGCAYKVEHVDRFPPSHFYEIPLACRISHLMGLLIFFTGICTAFALHPIDRGTYRQN
jgi:hypothetical protein